MEETGKFLYSLKVGKTLTQKVQKKKTDKSDYITFLKRKFYITLQILQKMVRTSEPMVHSKRNTKALIWEFPGCPVVRTLSFHCREHRFDPWSGNQDPACQSGEAKTIIIIIIIITVFSLLFVYPIIVIHYIVY